MSDDEQKTVLARVREVDRQCRDGLITWQERVRLLNEIAPGIGELSGQKKEGCHGHKIKPSEPRIRHGGGR